MTSLELDIRQVGKKQQIIKVSNGSVVIKMGKWTYYIDNSTGEEFITRWTSDDVEQRPSWNRQTVYNQ